MYPCPGEVSRKLFSDLLNSISLRREQVSKVKKDPFGKVSRKLNQLKDETTKLDLHFSVTLLNARKSRKDASHIHRGISGTEAPSNSPLQSHSLAPALPLPHFGGDLAPWLPAMLQECVCSECHVLVGPGGEELGSLSC